MTNAIGKHPCTEAQLPFVKFKKCKNKCIPPV